VPGVWRDAHVPLSFSIPLTSLHLNLCMIQASGGYVTDIADKILSWTYLIFTILGQRLPNQSGRLCMSLVVMLRMAEPGGCPSVSVQLESFPRDWSNASSITSRVSLQANAGRLSATGTDSVALRACMLQ
jgi:hypothetical protein